MAARSPEEWPQQFTQCLNAGDLDGVLALYEDDARFVDRSGETLVGRDRIRDIIAGLIDSRTRMHGQVVRSVVIDDVALLYSDFSGTAIGVSGAEAEVESKAVEVLRRQPNGTWKLIVGDPRGRT